MLTNELEQILNALLKPELIKDYCPNGLQIEGVAKVNKIVTGVTATQALIEQAVLKNADAIIVHHGYFWKNESYVIRGMKYQRIKALIENNINLFAYHLPLDIHAELGNNAQLAKLLDIDVKGPLEVGNSLSVAIHGEFAQAITGAELSTRLTDKLNRQCLHIAPESNKSIRRIAWCTGGGQDYIELAAEQGFDAFISGEASEKTTHIAKEMDIHFFAAGHHATERYGVKALGEHLTKTYSIDVEFIDIDNPV